MTRSIKSEHRTTELTIKLGISFRKDNPEDMELYDALVSLAEKKSEVPKLVRKILQKELGTPELTR